MRAGFGRAIDAIKSALVSGANIFTDVEIVRAGLMKGDCQIHCQIGSDEVKEFAVREGITRAMASMRQWGQELTGQVVVNRECSYGELIADAWLTVAENDNRTPHARIFSPP